MAYIETFQAYFKLVFQDSISSLFHFLCMAYMRYMVCTYNTMYDYTFTVRNMLQQQLPKG